MGVRRLPKEKPPKENICSYCGTKVFLPYQCNYCGGYFCPEHRLPESHNCPRVKGRSWGAFRAEQIKRAEPIRQPIPGVAEVGERPRLLPSKRRIKAGGHSTAKRWGKVILVFVVGSLILTLAINPQLREDIANWFGGQGNSGGGGDSGGSNNESEGVGDSGEPSISELVNNPAQYDSKKVTVEGDLTFGGAVEGALWMIWEGDDYIGIVMDLSTSYEVGWGETGRVKVIGIFQAPNKILAIKLEKA